MGVVPSVGVLASEGGGLLGRNFALTFIFVVSLALIFLLGFALRDALQKRGLRLRAAKKPEPAPPRQ
jgi:hypothetical protein